MFSENTRKRLHQAGWTPDRSIDISNDVRRLEQEGYQVFPVVTQFLQRYGRLVVTRKRRWLISEIDFHFDAADVASRTFIDRVHEYSDQLGLPLCVIGEVSHALLMINPQGEIYSGFGDLVLWGRNDVESIEHLVAGTPTHIILK